MGFGDPTTGDIFKKQHTNEVEIGVVEVSFLKLSALLRT